MKKLFLVLTICILTLVSCTAAGKWQAQYDLGVRYLNDGNYAEAIIAFTAAIEIDEKNVEAYLGRADAYIASGETEENLTLAFADYEKIISFDAANTEAYLGMADVYIRLGEYDKALEALTNIPESAKNEAVLTKIKELEGGSVTDSSGNQRKASGFDANGNLSWWHEYSYNSKGKKSSVTHYNADGIMQNSIDILYDDRGNVIQQYGYNPLNGELNRLTYEYNDSDQVIKVNGFYNNTDEITGFITYEYNDNGLNTKQTHLDPDGKLRYYTLYEYNSNNKISKYTNFWAEYHLSGETETVEIIMSNYYIFEYNERGQQVKDCRYSSEGELYSYTIYDYNGGDKVVKITDYNADGTVLNEVKYN